MRGAASRRRFSPLRKGKVCHGADLRTLADGAGVKPVARRKLAKQGPCRIRRKGPRPGLKGGQDLLERRSLEAETRDLPRGPWRFASLVRQRLRWPAADCARLPDCLCHRARGRRGVHSESRSRPLAGTKRLAPPAQFKDPIGISRARRKRASFLLISIIIQITNN
jgi:hypothetical protein